MQHASKLAHAQFEGCRADATHCCAAGSFSGGASGSGQPGTAPPPSGPSASAVVNLGVVGRGSKRINLQPVAAAAPAGSDTAGDSH